LTENEYQEARNYWKVLKFRLGQEGNETVTNCNRLKMTADDRKKRLFDVGNMEQIFRLIQSTPSKKAEPFKLWLARVGKERILEAIDPELAINRARENYRKMGRSEKWIGQRMYGQETRNKLTNYWADHNIDDPKDFARLTNIIHEEWAGVNISNHKKMKGLEKENLRDHMSEAELLFTALAELSTRQVAERDEAMGFEENKKSAIVGGRIAKNAREDFEQETGNKVVSGENHLLSSPK